MGVTNSLASLGRILGPIIGGIFYEQLAKNSPFLFASGLAFVAAFMLFLLAKRIGAKIHA